MIDLSQKNAEALERGPEISSTDASSSEEEGIHAERKLGPESIMKEEEPKEQWTSRVSFVLAAIGSAVGLGNFWRFPFRVFEWGGVFLLPYFIILLLIGIPILQLELAIGQTFQKSILGATLEVNPRMSGVGPAAAFLSFLLVSYYATVISWGVVYFVYSWMTPLKWDVSGVNESSTEEYIEIPGEVFNNLLDQSPNPAETYTISSALFAGTLFVWVSVYLILWKGAKVISKAVWFTVLGPCVLLLFLIIWGATLDGAHLGIEAYLGKWDFSVLSDPLIWQQAFTQVFFSLSVGTGALPTYASFNQRNNNVVQDGLIIGLFDAFFGLFSGFAVFTVAGFYSKQTGIPFTCDKGLDPECIQLNDVLGGPSLVFNVYPAAISLIGGYGANIICAILFLVFFLLGIDSAFSLVESPLNILREFRPFNRVSRSSTLMILISMLMLLSMLFISDIGLYWAGVEETINEDMGLLWIAYLEIILVAWTVNREVISDKVGYAAHLTFDLSCFVAVFLFSCLTLGGEAVVGISVAVVVLVLGTFTAFVLAQKHKNCSMTHSAYHLFLAGPVLLLNDMSSKIKEDRPKNWGLGALFAFNLKFIITPILTFMLCSAYKNILVVDQITAVVCRSVCDIAPPQYYVGATVMLAGLITPWVVGIFRPSTFRNV